MHDALDTGGICEGRASGQRVPVDGIVSKAIAVLDIRTCGDHATIVSTSTGRLPGVIWLGFALMAALSPFLATVADSTLGAAVAAGLCVLPFVGFLVYGLTTIASLRGSLDVLPRAGLLRRRRGLGFLRWRELRLPARDGAVVIEPYVVLVMVRGSLRRTDRVRVLLSANGDREAHFCRTRHNEGRCPGGPDPGPGNVIVLHAQNAGFAAPWAFSLARALRWPLIDLCGSEPEPSRLRPALAVARARLGGPGWSDGPSEVPPAPAACSPPPAIPRWTRLSEDAQGLRISVAGTLGLGLGTLGPTAAFAAAVLTGPLLFGRSHVFGELPLAAALGLCAGFGVLAATVSAGSWHRIDVDARGLGVRHFWTVVPGRFRRVLWRDVRALRTDNDGLVIALRDRTLRVRMSRAAAGWFEQTARCWFEGRYGKAPC